MGTKPSRFRVALTAGRLATRRLLRRKEGEVDVALGSLLSDQLDEMKGLAIKLGQIVSYMDVPLPESVQAQLSRLQTGVSGMDEAQTRQVLCDALGPDFETHIEALDYSPIAAASIGQVHRAQFGGRDIALKVQYPDVATSFRKDLGAIKTIASLASAATAVDGQAIVSELGARLAEECDYEREAAFQRAFAAAFDDVVIPDVIGELSTAKTLATAWCEGHGFAEACRWPQAQRNEVATTLVHFSYRSLLNLAAIQADPHPGNFLFREPAEVVCLDFGCVRRFDVEFVESLRRMIGALANDDRPALRDSVMALGMAPKPKRFDFEHQFEMMEHLHRPLLSESFEFTPQYVRDGLAYNGPSNPNARHQAIPPEYIWVARLQWGLWSLLTRLAPRFSYAKRLTRSSALRLGR